MKMLDFEEFAKEFGKAWKPKMNMSIYRDSFGCACGRSHWFDESIDIAWEGFQKFAAVCPDDPDCITSVKIKTFMIFKFKGFESLAGTRLASEDDALAFNVTRRVLGA